ncbi:hypothetical protein [Novosphingobium rosa]|uniref:hypothetical protein n=1 Tax=Novosphingobium rosa TaxID=76978 RepID=UPI0008308D5E|nr:hypothetical protein [Novosphingobium rosa]
MKAHWIDWIWHVRGSLPLAPGQSGEEAFGRLDPLFRQGGTTRSRIGDTLTFTKKDQAAQDSMSVFDGGVLQIRDGVVGPVLHYRLASRALLFCFLAPLLFLAFAQLTVALGRWEKPAAQAAGAHKQQKKLVELPQNPIDKMLGSPAPEKPKPDGKDGEDDKKKASPTSAYVFAAMFAVLYVVGRVLEGRLVRSLFRKELLGTGDQPPMALAG